MADLAIDRRWHARPQSPFLRRRVLRIAALHRDGIEHRPLQRDRHRADQRHLAGECDIGKRIHSERRGEARLDPADIRLGDLGDEFHPREIGGDGEQVRRLRGADDLPVCHALVDELVNGIAP